MGVSETMKKSLGCKMTVQDACKCGWNSVRIYGTGIIAYYDEKDDSFEVYGYDGPDEKLLNMEIQLDDFWQDDEDGYPIIYGSNSELEG